MARQLTLLMLLFLVKARITVELLWNTEKLSYQCCKSKNQLLLWNFTEGENERVMELQWFFNETTLICLESKKIGFHTETFYNGRIERNGTAGILLKDISVYDAGKYTLYVKLAEEKIRNVQDIFLTVYEQVPYQCKPRIEFRHQDVMYCSTTCLERSELSPEWIINGTQDPEGIGLYLRVDAGINEQALCCLRGLKCHDEGQFCIPNPISSKIYTQEGHNETSTLKARTDEGSNTSNVLIIMGVMMAVSFILIVITFACFMRRRCKSLDVKTKNLDTPKQCTEDYKEVDAIAGTTDRSLHHSNSNHNIQIVNNINMDGDIVKYMMETQRLLTIDLEAAREEIRELKRYLPSYQHPTKLETRLFDNSIEMTEMRCHHPNHNIIDASETSDYEDAVSEPLVHHY